MKRSTYLALIICLFIFIGVAKANPKDESPAVPIGYPTSGTPRITAPFGWRRFFGVRDFHGGVDLGINYGTPIYATHAGTVKYTWTVGGGYWIEIENGIFKTRYAHLSRRIAKVGSQVKRGDLLGYSGNSGKWTTGPHLHYEVWVLGQQVDPVPFLKEHRK